MRCPSLLLSLALLAYAVPSAADEIFYDDFSADARALTQTGLVNWNLAQGNVDVINPGESFGCPLATPGKCVDLDGTGGPLAILETKSEFSFEAGGKYTLFLDIPAVNTDGSFPTNHDGFRVTVGSLFMETFAMGSYAAPFSIDRAFTAVVGEMARIEIEMLDSKNDFGPFLSQVRLTQVPEPSSLLLVGAGLMLLAGRGRARRSR